MLPLEIPSFPSSASAGSGPLLPRRRTNRRSALHAGAVKHSFRRRHGQHRRRLGAAARLAEDHHLPRIAAEHLNVVAHPFERRHQVHHSDDAGVREFRGCAQIGEVQIPKARQPMIHRHHHHVAESRQLRSVVSRRIAGTGGEAAAMERDHHGALLSVVDARRPDVQRQAILAHAAYLLIPLDHHAVVAGQI